MNEEIGQMAIQMYADEPCRICGRLITDDDLMTVVFVGYSADNKSRAAHGRCWEGFLDVLRSAPADGLAKAGGGE